MHIALARLGPEDVAVEGTLRALEGVLALAADVAELDRLGEAQLRRRVAQQGRAVDEILSRAGSEDEQDGAEGERAVG